MCHVIWPRWTLFSPSIDNLVLVVCPRFSPPQLVDKVFAGGKKCNYLFLIFNKFCRRCCCYVFHSQFQQCDRSFYQTGITVEKRPKSSQLGLSKKFLTPKKEELQVYCTVSCMRMPSFSCQILNSDIWSRLKYEQFWGFEKRIPNLCPQAFFLRLAFFPFLPFLSVFSIFGGFSKCKARFEMFARDR